MGGMGGGLHSVQETFCRACINVETAEGRILCFVGWLARAICGSRRFAVPAAVARRDPLLLQVCPNRAPAGWLRLSLPLVIFELSPDPCHHIYHDCTEVRERGDAIGGPQTT